MPTGSGGGQIVGYRTFDGPSLLRGRSVVFVGLMGAGKTAVGRKVATLLGLPFIDSDHEIRTVSRMSVPELFERYGEPEFRELERRVILRLLREGPQVVSTGGGAFMNQRTRTAIREHGISVWLKTDLDVLVERVSRRSDRPLLRSADPRQVMTRLMEERDPVYASADLCVRTEDQPIHAAARQVVERLRSHCLEARATDTR
jgi:shikimate kinase